MDQKRKISINKIDKIFKVSCVFWIAMFFFLDRLLAFSGWNNYFQTLLLRYGVLNIFILKIIFSAGRLPAQSLVNSWSGFVRQQSMIIRVSMAVGPKVAQRWSNHVIDKQKRVFTKIRNIISMSVKVN